MTKEQKEEFLQYLENLKLIQADDFYREGLDMAISALKGNEWIPIKTRPLTAEEKEYCTEHGAYYFDSIFDCHLPEDGQEVLITTNNGEVETVTFYNEGDDGSYFEYYEGEGEVLAWQPKPEPYKKGE